MMKRFFALFLCLLMCSACLFGCKFEEKEEVQLTPEEEELLKGAVINIHLGELIYDFDPANAYHNETAMKIISLLYEPLYYLDDNGKLKSNLIKKYEIVEDEEEGEYMMILYIHENAYWSDGTYVSANDVVYTWKRVLEAEASYDAAALLFDIKNARAANQGDTSIDNIGLSAPSDKRVEILFEGRIDYKQFLMNLTSYALAPLRENLATKTSFYTYNPYGDDATGDEADEEVIVRKYNDWAKKGATMASSGPFKLRTIEYPDDAARDPLGNYIHDENGNLLYYRYGIDADTGTTLVELRKGVRYEIDANGQTIAYTESYMNELMESDPGLYSDIATRTEVVQGLPSDYALEPQNFPQIILERNNYYFKDMDVDNWAVDRSVKPYRLVIDYSLSDEEIMQKYDNGEIFYVGDIPMSMRSSYKDSATITNGLSTHSYYLNQNAYVTYSFIEFNEDGTPVLFDSKGALVSFDPATGLPIMYKENGELLDFVFERDENDRVIYQTADGVKISSDATAIPITGEKIFANADVRNALSLAIDREAIANALVFAEAAGAIVPSGVFEPGTSKKTFRENGTDYIAKNANKDAALQKLASSGIDASKFVIDLSYAEYDEVHAYVAATVAALWTDLGFSVNLKPLRTIDNEDLWTTTQEILSDVKDDMWLETLISADYDVMAMDMVALTADPFSVLAPFAKLFSGMGMNMRNFNEYGEQQYVPATHITGFDDETYNQMIEDIYAEKTIADRSEALHAAEKYLVEQMPIIPIVYNQNAVLVNDEMLTNVTSSYYAPAVFTDTYLKDTIQYDSYTKKIMITTIVIVAVVIVVAGITVLTVILRTRAKKREEEIARISAEHEAKLREIRPGSRKS